MAGASGQPGGFAADGLGWPGGGVSGALAAAPAAGASPAGAVFVVLAILVIPLVAFPVLFPDRDFLFPDTTIPLRAWEGKLSSRLSACLNG